MQAQITKSYTSVQTGETAMEQTVQQPKNCVNIGLKF